MGVTLTIAAGHDDITTVTQQQHQQRKTTLNANSRCGRVSIDSSIGLASDNVTNTEVVRQD